MKWLNENMDRYKVKDIYNLEIPYDVMQEYYDDNKNQALTKFIKNAINLIETRFDD